MYSILLFLFILILIVMSLRRVRSKLHSSEDAEAEFERQMIQAAYAAPPAPAPQTESCRQVDLIQDYEQRLEIAGLIASQSGDNLQVTGTELRARLLRLNNSQQILIVSAEAPADWIESMLRLHDYALLVSSNGARVVRRFEGFLVDRMFEGKN